MPLVPPGSYVYELENTLINKTIHLQDINKCYRYTSMVMSLGIPHCTREM